MKSKHFESYLPEGALSFVEEWIKGKDLTIKIRNSRRTKLGDYRFFRELNAHQITINDDISPDAFFFVLTHEIAHLLVRTQFKTNVKSHGREWKFTFAKLLRASLDVYPAEMRPVIFRHSQNPKATLNADRFLHKILFQPEEENSFKRIENLLESQKFRMGNRIFEKGKKRKIRYLCREIQTGKLYTVSGSAIADEIY